MSRPLEAVSAGTPASGQRTVSAISPSRSRAPAASVARGGPVGESLVPGRPARPGAAHPRLEHPAHAVALQHADQARDVVLVRVREHHEVEPAVPRRHACVELHQQPLGVRTAVHEHARTRPALDEDRVALPHVQDDEAVRPSRGVPEGQRREGDDDASRGRAGSGPGARMERARRCADPAARERARPRFRHRARPGARCDCASGRGPRDAAPRGSAAGPPARAPRPRCPLPAPPRAGS